MKNKLYCLNEAALLGATTVHAADPRSRTRLRSLAAAFVVVGVLTAGCSTQRAIKEAYQRHEAGDAVTALAGLQAALKDDIHNPELRLAYLRLREQSIAQHLIEAENALIAVDVMRAETAFRKVLELDPTNNRAATGLERTKRVPLLRAWMDEAEQALARKDLASASERLKQVLAEDSRNSRAAELLRSIEEQIIKPLMDPQLSDALKRTVSVDFKDISVRQLFDVLSRISGLNFVFDRDVRNDLRTTLSLKNSSVKDAMELALMSSQLEYRALDHNTVLIYPNTPAKLKDYQYLVLRTFFLTNADPEQLAAALRSLLKFRDIVVDKKQSMIMVRDTPEGVRLAEKVVALYDLPEPEVMLEVEILEVNRTRFSELGIKLPDQLSLAPITTDGGTGLTLQQLRNLNSAAIGAAITSLTFNARDTDTDVKILANPRIRVRNKEAAKILIGDKVPNITSTSTSTGFVAESVQYIDVGLKLDVMPTISIDNEIAIKIALEVSNVAGQVRTSAGTAAYQIGTRSASTTLRLKDGENQVLAGLINHDDRRTANKTPVLGDVPIAGRLFSNHLDETKNSEIVLSITPRLIRQTPRPSRTLLELPSGTEGSLRHSGLIDKETTIATVPTNERSRTGSANQVTSNSNPSPSTPTGVSATGVLSSTAGGTHSMSKPVVLRWSGTTSTAVGQSLTVQLRMASTVAVAAIPYSLAYDPAMLELLKVQGGNITAKQNTSGALTYRDDKSTGQLFVTQTLGVAASAASGQQGSEEVLISVTFKAKAKGLTQVNLVGFTPKTVDGSTLDTTALTPLQLDLRE
jgi:general secretion pathway protein D